MNWRIVGPAAAQAEATEPHDGIAADEGLVRGVLVVPTAHAVSRALVEAWHEPAHRGVVVPGVGRIVVGDDVLGRDRFHEAAPDVRAARPARRQRGAGRPARDPSRDRCRHAAPDRPRVAESDRADRPDNDGRVCCTKPLKFNRGSNVPEEGEKSPKTVKAAVLPVSVRASRLFAGATAAGRGIVGREVEVGRRGARRPGDMGGPLQ